MKTLKICFFLFGLLFLLNVKVQAQCFAPVSIRSVPHAVSLNADNSIDIPIIVNSNKACPLTLKVWVYREKNSPGGVTMVVDVADQPTNLFQTIITIPDAQIDDVYIIRCGSEEYGFNDGGCTIVVVP